jgi:hypothetical protein
MVLELPEWVRHRLLFELPAHERERLIRHADVLDMERGETVHERGEPFSTSIFHCLRCFRWSASRWRETPWNSAMSAGRES